MVKSYRLTFPINPELGNDFPTKENISLYSLCVVSKILRKFIYIFKAAPRLSIRPFKPDFSFVGKSAEIEIAIRERDLVPGWVSGEGADLSCRWVRGVYKTSIHSYDPCLLISKSCIPRDFYNGSLSSCFKYPLITIKTLLQAAAFVQCFQHQ